MGFGVWGLGFGVWGLGFGVWGLGFGVWVLGFGVWGLGFGVWGLGFGFWGLGFGVSGVWGRLPKLHVKSTGRGEGRLVAPYNEETSLDNGMLPRKPFKAFAAFYELLKNTQTKLIESLLPCKGIIGLLFNLVWGFLSKLLFVV